MRKLIIVGLCLLGIVACNQLTDQQSQKLDDLNETLLSAKQEILTADTSKINKSMADFDKSINFLMNKVSDTIDRKLAIHISKYHRLEKSFSKYKNNYKKSIDDLVVLEKQLSDLEHDGSKGILSEDEFDKYFQDEFNNIQMAVENATDVKNIMNVLNYQYDSLKPRVDSFIKAYKIEYTE